MKKIKPLLIIMIFLLTVIMPFVKVDSEPAIVDNSLMNSQAIEEPTTPITTTSEGWFERETVLSDIEFNIQGYDFDYFSVHDDIDFTIYEQNRHDSYSDDSQYYRYQVAWNPSISGTSYLINGRIYCGGVGTLTYQQRLRSFDGVATDYTVMADSTYAVASDMLDSLGYLYFFYEIEFSSSSNTLDLELFVYDVSTDWADTSVYAVEESGGASFAELEILELETDVFIFERDTIENNIRSEYQYVSDTMITHKLTIPSVTFSKEINLYCPTHWSYSSISPTATVTQSSSDYTITSPTELIYTMFFTSNSTYLLAIEDTTINYISNTEANFEGGTKDGWYDSRDYIGLQPMDIFEVSTDMSQDGYHSLHIQTSTDPYPTASVSFDETSDVNLAEGFYLSFWYYWVSTDTFRFSVRNELNNGWGSYTLPTTITDRWIRYSAYFDGTCITDGVKSIEFYGADASSTMEIFIDNFQIFTVSTEIDTVDLDEYEISSTFISWDGYQNPVLTYEEVVLELWDRTAIDQLDYETGTTNSLGVVSWTYESSLEQKEYTVFARHIRNNFGAIAHYSFENNGKDESSNNYDWTMGTSDYAVGKYGFAVDGVDNVGDLADNDDFDFTDTENMYIGCWVKTSDAYNYQRIITKRESSTVWYSLFIHDDGKVYMEMTSDYGTYGSDQIHGAIVVNDGNWHFIEFVRNIDDQIYQLFVDYKLDKQGVLLDGWVGDISNAFGVELMQWDNAAGQNYSGLLDNLQIANNRLGVDFHFTPSYPYNLDYAEEVVEDAWDFSEGDEENWDGYGYCALNDIINGYQSVRKTGTSTDYFSTYSPDDLGVDSDYYTKVEIRMRLDSVEAGASWRWYLAAYTPNFDQQDYTHALTESWQIFSINLESSKTIDRLRLYVYEENDNKTTTVNLFTDFIRLVHVEEPETFLTNTYLGFGSENDKWISAVYSDSVFLGYYNDPNLVYLNQTIGTHTISRLPVARQGETKAFLYSNIYTYTYSVSEPSNYFLLLNPPSYDVSAGLIYVDLVTYYNNCTYRVKLNETFLGDAVEEGSSVWSCDFSQAGFYNFTVYVYQGGTVWRTLASSITIPSTEVENLQLLLLTKDVDTSVSQVFVNYHTNWGNTTLIVFDNSTQLGNELSGEGASIWSFSQMDYYAFHNISVCIYHNSELQFIYHFSFTIQVPVTDPANYFILLNPPSYDIDAGLIYLDVVTYYGNCTYQVKMNESSLGDAVNEGSSVWSCDFSQAGFYNFTVYVYQGATVWRTLTSSITIAEPAAPEGLIIEIWNKDVDVAAGLIYINVITSWGNQSVRLQDNSTWLGDYASEGASIWLFPTTFGLHNISIWLYNDLTPVFVEYFSFTIQEPSLEIFTVHFDLFTIAGIGLPFETAKIYVNDSRIYNPQQYYLEDSFIEVKVRDYYNHLLFATNATITANRDIALYVRLFGQQIRNTYKIPIEVYFISTFDSNYNHSYVVAAEGSISVLLFSSSYHVLVKPLQDEYQNSTHVTYFYATTSEYQDLGDETKSYTISMETDLEPLDLEEPKEVRTWPAWVIAASAIFINAILISFIGAMGKWGIVKIWNYGLYYPNYGANWILRKFGSERELHWCVEHKGGLEFVTPEQYRKAEALKKEGQF